MKIKFVFANKHVKPEYLSVDETESLLKISRLKVLKYHAKKYKLVYAEDKHGKITCYKSIQNGWEEVEVKKKINIK